VLLDKISKTSNPKIDHCSVCNKDVHIVETYEELIDKGIEKQLCVAFDFDLALHNERTDYLRDRNVKGKMRRK